MKNLTAFDIIPFTEETKKKVIYLIDSYKRLGIYIRIVKYQDGPHSGAGTIFIQIEQKKYINDKVLTTKELIERGKEVFAGKLPPGVRVIVSPIFNNSDELRGVNADYVKARLDKFQLKPAQVAKGLDLDKSTISLLLSGEREFTKPMRAAFYYYLKNQELIERVTR